MAKPLDPTNYAVKAVGDAILDMIKTKPTEQSTEGTMYAMKRVSNGYLVSVIPQGSSQGELLVFTDWNEMVDEIRRRMHPDLAENGH